MTCATILVQLDLNRPVAPLLAFGLDLAGEFGAHLIAFAAAEARVFVPGDEEGLVTLELLRGKTEQIEKRLKAMEQEFLDIVGGDQHASWRGVVGDTSLSLALHARAADLIVVGPTEKGPDLTFGPTLDRGSIVLSAGRPMLAAAAGYNRLRLQTVVVAWKDTREARRAVVDAVPLLGRAQEVVVVAIDEGDQEDHRSGVDDIAHFLKRHGVKASAEIVTPANDETAAEAMSGSMRALGADLVIAGAYGHSRVREWAFGGMTRSLLSDESVHRFISN